MAKETASLVVRMSPKLKEDFRALCNEDEIDMSDKVREIIANLVRNRKRQLVKSDAKAN
ncbi:hypothetical protein GO755_19020 [Spirosoma sp. HMF4905]|uniref:CopG family transcriptional regulator n=1 Tax=Spirosoma arboris TaxID=2682092 RepID=A0A7K1SEC3_9BACT|nr:hypothetical protein [Spirosoma arboris]MVM32150.1 hypothetical protein [Spirosoma arboris]